MSQTRVTAPDPDVAAQLADYDKTHAINALKDAAAAAARHDGEIPADPAAGPAIGQARLANWLDIMSRFRRDLDPDFDPDHPPSMNIVPPGPHGRQYAPGVNPKDVKDPVMREAYIAAIEKNRILLQNFGANIKLQEAQLVVREQAISSISDAQTTLGLTAAAIRASVTAASLLESDRAALLAAVK